MWQMLAKWWQKHMRFIGTVAVGHGAKQVEEVLFDWILYGTVVGFTIYVYGPVWGSLLGFLIMAPLSALVCWLYLQFYDWAKIDWFGFEAVKNVREDLEGDSWWKRLLRRLVRMGDVPAFFVLSINSDPFMVTVYLRRGSGEFNGMTGRDWKIFWASVLFSNAYWTLRWTVIIAIALWLFAFFPPSLQATLLSTWETLRTSINALF